MDFAGWADFFGGKRGINSKKQGLRKIFYKIGFFFASFWAFDASIYIKGITEDLFCVSKAVGRVVGEFYFQWFLAVGGR